MGVRNSAHVLAKLINPFENKAWQISNYTHPEYLQSLRQYFELNQSNAILMRGNEGEPVGSLTRLPSLQCIQEGKLVFSSEECRFTEMEPTIHSDLQSTTRYFQTILCGELPMPLTVTQQTDSIFKMVH